MSLKDLKVLMSSKNSEYEDFYLVRCRCNNGVPTHLIANMLFRKDYSSGKIFVLSISRDDTSHIMRLLENYDNRELVKIETNLMSSLIDFSLDMYLNLNIILKEHGITFNKRLGKCKTDKKTYIK